MIELKGAFATRWYEEWAAAERMSIQNYASGNHDKRRVELFLEAMK
jgi:hypothetical protein